MRTRKEMSKYWDRIKGLILQRLNAYCGAAAIHEPPQCMRRNVVYLVHCVSCIAAAAMHDRLHSFSCIHEPQFMICAYRSLLGWVDFSLPQRRNISPFIPSPKYLLPPLKLYVKKGSDTNEHHYGNDLILFVAIQEKGRQRTMRQTQKWKGLCENKGLVAALGFNTPCDTNDKMIVTSTQKTP